MHQTYALYISPTSVLNIHVNAYMFGKLSTSLCEGFCDYLFVSGLLLCFYTKPPIPFPIWTLPVHFVAPSTPVPITPGEKTDIST